MNGIGQNIGAGIVQGIVSSSAQLSSVAREYIVNPVVEAVRSGFDVHSPSRVMAAIGKFLPAGLAKGITSAATAPVRAMQSVVSKVSAAAKSAVDKGVGGEALYRGYSGVTKAASGVKNRLSSALNGGAYSDRLGGASLQGIHNAADTVLAKTASGVKALPRIFGSAKSAISSSAKSVAQHVQEQKGLNIHLGKNSAEWCWHRCETDGGVHGQIGIRASQETALPAVRRAGQAQAYQVCAAYCSYLRFDLPNY